MSDDISIVLQSVDEIINVTIDDSVYAITNWGGIYGSLADQTDLQAALDAKVDDSEVVTVATASKLLKLDANAALPADITGNAATATEVAWSGVSGRPATYPPASHSVDSHSDWPATVSMVEVGYLNGVSSGVQGQLDGKEPANANIQQHIADTLNPHGVTASQVGLGNVTNAAQVLRTEMGTASGVATLGADGKVPSGQLPSYVDDVLEYANLAAFPTSGETAKIYVALDTNLTYRWSGSAYVEISQSLALGETSATAYYGDKGKIAYDHSQSAHAKTTAIDATDHATLDHTGLTGIPAPYALPTASTTVLGGVKVDGTSITITDGVVSAAGTGTGDVVGPASAVNNNIAVFDGITGKIIKDSGSSIASFEAAGAVSGHVSTYDHSKLHDAVTVSGNGISVVGQQVSLSIGTGATQVAQGDHAHTGVYEPADATILKDADIGVTVQAYDADLTSWAGVAPSSKQDALVSGTNIKTINNESLLGSGNITVAASGVVVTVSGTLTLYVTQQTTLTITNYDSATNYSVSAVSGTASITGDTITYTAGNTAGTDTLTITAGASSRDISITVNAAGVATPTNSSPANGATDQGGPSLTLTASAFAWVGLSDTHASSDWQLSTVSDFSTTVTHSDADTTNKTSWTVTVSTSQTYYWRVRYRGASGRVSDWSTGTSLTTKATFGGLIGTQGGQGFGVGVYIGTLPSGFSALTGTTDTASDNYGNYQYSDGSIMCFVPKFYYRIGSASSPRYATYGANAVDIAGIDTFADETAANAAGYVLHRAFIDGGSVKSGFFIDKYLCSKNGTTSGKSVKNGDPISLTTNASYNPSSTMTGCTGILADAVVLSRARGAGVFNVASIFMYSALALLSLAHGQAATATTYCAWYDSGLTTNFPKGCNNGSLADTNDATVTYSVSSISPKPLTGSASNLAKTTHNGQNCGVADLNGAMYQVMLGLTDFGTSATDTTVHANGNVYLLKTSVALSSLTAGWDGSTDAWGNTTSLATKYDAVSGLLPWGSTTGWLYMGNGTNRVLDPAASGAGYQRTSCGIPQDTNALSAAGTNQYGNDGQYQYNRANLFPLASGDWSTAASAGVFYRLWTDGRSSGNGGSGFRASAYGA